MHLELDCACCSCRFVAPTQSPDNDFQDSAKNDEPWYALGDGNTFEDSIFTTLTERGAISCPECGAPIAVSEESLGQLAMEMLAAF
jgi:hypothetical protein